MYTQDTDKVMAYAMFLGRVSGIAKAIKWADLDVNRVEEYLTKAIIDVEKELSEINSRKNDL